MLLTPDFSSLIFSTSTADREYGTADRQSSYSNYVYNLYIFNLKSILYPPHSYLRNSHKSGNTSLVPIPRNNQEYPRFFLAFLPYLLIFLLELFVPFPKKSLLFQKVVDLETILFLVWATRIWYPNKMSSK